MMYVSVITLVTYALVLGLLAVVSIIDVRSRRVPNVLAGALGLLWVAWRVVLGFAGAHMGLGFRAEFLGPAPDVLVPPGLEIGGISFANGILGAVVLGGGLLVLTTVYELVRRKEAFGGGDIKLMAVLGLFLGLERGIVCLLTACVLSVAYVLGRELGRRVMGRGRRDCNTGAATTSARRAFPKWGDPGGFRRAGSRFSPRRHYALRPFHRPRHPRRLRRVSQENRENRPLGSGSDKKVLASGRHTR